MSNILPRTLPQLLTAAFDPDLPGVKPVTSMPEIVGGADQDFDAPKGPAIDRL
jgi:hypothetical protein